MAAVLVGQVLETHNKKVKTALLTLVVVAVALLTILQ
jgi:hypothetical protein